MQHVVFKRTLSLKLLLIHNFYKPNLEKCLSFRSFAPDPTLERDIPYWDPNLWPHKIFPMRLTINIASSGFGHLCSLKMRTNWFPRYSEMFLYQKGFTQASVTEFQHFSEVLPMVKNRCLRNLSPTPRLWETSSRLATNAVTRQVHISQTRVTLTQRGTRPDNRPRCSDRGHAVYNANVSFS